MRSWWNPGYYNNFANFLRLMLKSQTPKEKIRKYSNSRVNESLWYLPQTVPILHWIPTHQHWLGYCIVYISHHPVIFAINCWILGSDCSSLRLQRLCMSSFLHFVLISGSAGPTFRKPPPNPILISFVLAIYEHKKIICLLKLVL